MLTKNFKAMISCWFANCRGNEVSYRLKKMDGNISTAQWKYTQLTYEINDSPDKYFFHIGNGETEPTVNDYSMENEITSLTLVEDGNYNGLAGWNVGDAIFYTDRPTGAMGDIITATYRNETNSHVTISEVGYSVKDTSNNGQFLIFREVIEPITLKPNEVYTFTFKIL